jgi:hypothetical protein
MKKRILAALVFTSFAALTVPGAATAEPQPTPAQECLAPGARCTSNFQCCSRSCNGGQCG